MRGKKIRWGENLKIFKKIHNNKYIYDETIALDTHIDSHEKIKIICPEHGEFIQKVCAHKRNRCSKCSNIEKGRKQAYSKEIFIERARKVHKDLYDYSFVEYKNNRTKVKIYCKKCKKIFEQTPCAHCQGEECKICAYEKAGFVRRKTTEKFIIEAQKIHGNKFDYSEVIYNSSEEKIKLKCNTCNYIFYPTPNNHLGKASGCMNCAILNKTGENSMVWNHNLTDKDRERRDLSPEGRKWKILVNKKYNFTCQITGGKSHNRAHHLDGYNWCIDKRYDVENGILINKNIHDVFHLIYGFGDNTKEQFEEYVESLYLLL